MIASFAELFLLFLSILEFDCILIMVGIEMKAKEFCELIGNLKDKITLIILLIKD
jgi:hypothetical protein